MMDDDNIMNVSSMSKLKLKALSSEISMSEQPLPFDTLIFLP
jgi:hypothetical protein